MSATLGKERYAAAAAHATWYLPLASDPLANEPTLTLPKRAGKP